MSDTSIQALRGQLSPLLGVIGPSWRDVVVSLQGILDTTSYLFVWETICTLYVQAEARRVIPGLPWDDASEIAKALQERTSTVAEWALTHGRGFKLREPSDVIVGLFLLRRHMGYGGIDAKPGGKVGIPRSRRGVDSFVRTPASEAIQEMQEHFDRILKPENNGSQGG